MNSLPPTIVSATETSCKMAPSLCQKMVLKNSFLGGQKAIWPFRIIWFGSNFASMWSKYVSNNVWRDFRLLVSAFETVARKSFNGKSTTFYVTITYADIGSLKSLYTLFDKYLDDLLVNLNKILW